MRSFRFSITKERTTKDCFVLSNCPLPNCQLINTTALRYSFNGKEDEIFSEWQDYGFRNYDKKQRRFTSVDPLTAKYPWYTPYQFAGNRVIEAVDLDGGEPKKGDKSYGKYVLFGNQYMLNSTLRDDNKLWIGYDVKNIEMVKAHIKGLTAENIKVKAVLIQSHGSAGSLAYFPANEDKFDMTNGTAMMDSKHTLEVSDFEMYFEYNQKSTAEQEKMFEYFSTEKIAESKQKFQVISDLKTILDNVEEGGLVILAGCNSGYGEENYDLMAQIDKLASHRLNIYMNQDFTNYSKYTKSEKYSIFERTISDGNYLNEGWRLFANGREARKGFAIQLQLDGEPINEVEIKKK